MAKTKRIFVVYVEDKPGVLNRVASLFRRRAFNIDSLSVGHRSIGIFMSPVFLAGLKFYTLEPQRPPQWVSEGSTRESEKAKEVRRTPFLIARTQR